MSERESPAAIIMMTTGSVVSPPPTTINDELMTTPAISRMLRRAVTRTPVRGRGERSDDGREWSTAESFMVVSRAFNPRTPGSSDLRVAVAPPHVKCFSRMREMGFGADRRSWGRLRPASRHSIFQNCFDEHSLLEGRC